MGRQTWVNFTGGGHTLPEETGASRLASTLIALYLLSHKRTTLFPFTKTHTCYKPVLQNFFTAGTQNSWEHNSDSHILFIHPFLYITILFSALCFLHNPIYGLNSTSPPPHGPLPLTNPICVPPPPVCRCHPSKRLPTGCVSCDSDESAVM